MAIGFGMGPNLWFDPKKAKPRQDQIAQQMGAVEPMMAPGDQLKKGFMGLGRSQAGGYDSVESMLADNPSVGGAPRARGAMLREADARGMQTPEHVSGVEPGRRNFMEKLSMALGDPGGINTYNPDGSFAGREFAPFAKRLASNPLFQMGMSMMGHDTATPAGQAMALQDQYARWEQNEFDQPHRVAWWNEEEDRKKKMFEALLARAQGGEEQALPQEQAALAGGGGGGVAPGAGPMMGDGNYVPVTPMPQAQQGVPPSLDPNYNPVMQGALPELPMWGAGQNAPQQPVPPADPYSQVPSSLLPPPPEMQAQPPPQADPLGAARGMDMIRGSPLSAATDKLEEWIKRHKRGVNERHEEKMKKMGYR